MATAMPCEQAANVCQSCNVPCKALLEICGQLQQSCILVCRVQGPGSCCEATGSCPGTDLVPSVCKAQELKQVVWQSLHMASSIDPSRVSKAMWEGDKLQRAECIRGPAACTIQTLPFKCSSWEHMHLARFPRLGLNPGSAAGTSRLRLMLAQKLCKRLLP